MDEVETQVDCCRTQQGVAHGPGDPHSYQVRSIHRLVAEVDTMAVGWVAVAGNAMVGAESRRAG